ncbi:hypothetical protein KSP40_PGU002118 [Platanthera guangdongensis]|uniref:PLAC8 motif-containing protein n=1 Tax=Platanthera guangdongensis TaxID=2320717 RepID=A0ABR2LEC9_9ASPA
MVEIVNGENKEEDEKVPQFQKLCENRFFDFLKATPSEEEFLKFDSAPSSFSFGCRSRSQSQIIDISSNPSPPDPTPDTNDGGGCFCIPFIRKIKWESLFTYCKNWVKHPMNISLLIWIFFVAACLIALFLLMTGLLNRTIRKDSDRKKWTEILNQILNALFTIMCLYQHPRITHHLVLLCRYGSKDILELRSIYCKNGRRKPHERAHMMFVVILLQITCWSQYGLCALYWAFTSKTRPDWPQILFIALGTGAPIIAGVYTVFSPLGRKNHPCNDEEFQRNYEACSVENELKLYDKRVIVASPEWAGGPLDCWDDKSVFCLSFFCTFCVFGWNMERLGFGNMYVHIITFILLCSAPVIVFGVAALNIYNDTIRYLVGIAGITLCLLGLLYGGFWRIQMRRRFKLPGNGFCCGFLAPSDFMQWFFCWSCSLAQEVRTGNFYDVENDGFCRKDSKEGSERVLTSLSGENVAGDAIITLRLDSGGGSHHAQEEDVDVEMIICRGEEEVEVVINEMMRPPVQSWMKEEDDEVSRNGM